MAAIRSDTWEERLQPPQSSFLANRYLSFDVPTIVLELFCGIVRLLAATSTSEIVVLMAVDPG